MRTALSSAIDRDSLISWYRRNRERSRALFDLLSDDAYYSQPIALRHPIVFYEGHLPAFSFNTLSKRALGAPSIDARLESLFARGIDPDVASADRANARDVWPDRATVHAFADEADRQVLDALEHADLEQPGVRGRDAGGDVLLCAAIGFVGRPLASNRQHRVRALVLSGLARA